MLNAQTRWKLPSYSAEEVSRIEHTYHVSPLVAKLLASREIKTDDQIQSLLHIKKQKFHDPLLMRGMTEAVQRIHLAIQHREKIRVYGDYDCDGVTSTAIMSFLMHELNAHYDTYIPNRFTEGYGLNQKALEQAYQDGIQLLITVDTGITAKDEIEYAQSLGMDVIVTDHHQPPAALPDCAAVINPHSPGCSYPYRDLSGAGIALKLAHAVLGRIPMEWMDVAALGTIADLVPLTGENRLIAYHGLKTINQTRHKGLEALMKIAGLNEQVVNEEHIGFALAPRINASGRLEHADIALQLLLTQEKEKALELAEELDRLNKQRQQLVDDMTTEAVEWVDEQYPGPMPRVLVVAKEGWHEGVIGIVASRLVERYYLPTIVCSIDTETNTAKGSARSIEGFDMYQALRECGAWLSHFGGHPMAAGMSLSATDIEPLRKQLNQLAEQWCTEDDYIPLHRIDIICSVDEITLESLQELNHLAPYGVQNQKPMVMIEKADVGDLRQVGRENRHLKCRVQDQEATLDGIGFGLGELVPHISRGATSELIGHIGINEWNGRESPQMMIKDMRIPHRQFFDWRGGKPFQRKWEHIIFDKEIAVCQFRNHPAHTHFFSDVSFPYPYRHLICDHDTLTNDRKDSFSGIDTVIMYDLPRSLEQLQQVCRALQHVKRYYLIFQHDDHHFLATIPTREHFRWYYAFLRQKREFNLNQHALKLAKHKGWTVDAVHFMTEVFQELEFVAVENGVVHLVKNPHHKELNQSYTYRQKQAEIEVQQTLIYSPYKELVPLLEHYMTPRTKKEMIAGGF